MTSTDHLAYWDDELAELDEEATTIFGKAAVLAAIARVSVPGGGDVTRANILAYRQAVKAELRRLVRPQ